MAINRPIILPDPVGSFNESFRTFDTTVRDQRRLALEERRLAEAAIERARQAKGEDFKLMLAAVSQQNEQAQRAIANDIRYKQLGISNYTAQTSRYNALTPSGRASRPNPDNVMFGGTPGGATGTGATPIGMPAGPLDLPGVTGPTGDMTGSTDLPTGRAGWQPPILEPLPPEEQGGPTNDLMPGDMVEPPMAPDDNTPVPKVVVVPEDSAPKAVVVEDAPAPVSPPTPAEMLTSPAPPEFQLPDPLNPYPEITAALVSPPPVTPTTAAPMPEPLVVESFGAADISIPIRKELRNLEVEGTRLAKEAAMANSDALRYARANPDPEYVPQQQQKIAEAQERAIEASAKATELEFKAKRLLADEARVAKRQEVLASLGDLDKVLPAKDRQALLKNAENPRSAEADTQLTALTFYADARRNNPDKLSQPSKGIETARNVAAAWAQLRTKEGQEEAKADAYYKAAQAELEKLPKNEEERTDAQKQAAKDWQKLLIDNTVPARTYNAKLEAFDKAVKADTYVDPATIKAPAAPAPGMTNVVMPEQEVINLATLGLETPAETAAAKLKAESDAVWTKAKAEAAARANLDKFDEKTLRLIASGRGQEGPVPERTPFGQIPKWSDITRAKPEGERYSKLISDKLLSGMEMPPGYDNPKLSGRKAPLTPEDALIAAAKERVEILDMKAKGKGLSPEKREIADELLE